MKFLCYFKHSWRFGHKIYDEPQPVGQNHEKIKLVPIKQCRRCGAEIEYSKFFGKWMKVWHVIEPSHKIVFDED